MDNKFNTKFAKKSLGLAIIPSLVIGNILGNFILNYKRMRENQHSPLALILNFSFKFWPIYIFVFITLFVWGYILIKRRDERTGDLRKGNKGTARFLTEGEVKKVYKAIDYSPKYDKNGNVIRYPGEAGFLVSCDEKNDVAYIDVTDGHGFADARSRGGKDQGLLLPSQEQQTRSEERPHIITCTTKYETIEYVGEEFKKRGYELNILNLIDPDASIGYNVLQLAADAYLKGNIDDAVELCDTFTYPTFYDPTAKERFWWEAAMYFVNALILATCHEFVGPDVKQKQLNMVTLPSVVGILQRLTGSYNIGETELNKLDTYFDSLPMDVPARMMYMGAKESAGTMRASIFSSATHKLISFMTPKIARMLRESTFDLTRFLQTDKPQYFMIVMPDYSESYYPIATAFIEQFYYVASKFAVLNHDRLSKRIFIHLNEFNNMTALKSIISLLTVGAGRGILAFIYSQGLKLIEAKYGKEKGEVIPWNVMNTYFLASSDPYDLKVFSDKTGPTERIEKTRSEDSKKGISTSDQVHQRPLIQPDELSRLLVGECLVIPSKRVDESGGDSVPFPILNKGNSRLRMAFNYLSDIFQKKSLSELDLPFHQNQNFTDVDYRYVGDVFEDRIRNYGPEPIRMLLGKDNQLERFEQRYANNDNLVDSELLTDQDLEPNEVESIYQTPLYLMISEKIIAKFPDLMDEFNEVETENSLHSFIRKHIDLFDDV